jgi:hypothetical protein
MNELKGKTSALFSLVLFISLLVVVNSRFAWAQTSASISGRLEDVSGAGIPGATVTVTSVETGAARTVTADETGNYRVLSLPVGQYAVRAERPGFNPVLRTGINIVVDQQAVVNLRLEIGAVQQEVTVTEEAPLVNTSTASVSGLVAEQQVKDLPLNGRSFDNLVTLNVGAVNFTANTKTAASGSGPGNYFAVAGRRPAENLFLLNGVEYTGTSTQTVTPGGVSGQLLGIDAVREFNVQSDAYSAEYGKRSGAQVSIVTQSGTNHLHGTAFEFLRNSALDARNFFDVQSAPKPTSVPPFKRNQFGGAAGAPIRKDSTFIFGNYEGFRQRLGISNVAVVPDDNARRGYLPNAQGAPTPVTGLNSAMLPYMIYWPVANGQNLGSGMAYAYSNPKQSIQEDFGNARVDHILSTKDSLSGIYTIDSGNSLTPQADPLFAAITNLRSQVASIQEVHVFTPEVINTLRVGFSRARSFFDSPPLVPFPASLSFFVGQPPGGVIIGGSATTSSSSITTAGASNAPNAHNARNLFTYSDDVQLVKGKHQITVGAWFQRLQNNTDAAGQKAGRATFASLQTFMQGITSNFSGTPSPAAAGFRMLMGAWYVEDNITVRPNLTLRIGLRHEFTNGWNEVLGREAAYVTDANGILKTDPMVGNIFSENNAKWLFGPRIGLAWDPFGKGKTSIRAGFGTYYYLQDSIAYMPDNTRPFNGVISFGQNVSLPPLVPVNPQIPVPPSCNVGVPQPCATYAPQSVQANMKTPTVEKWNFTVERQITANMVFRAAYVGSHAFHELLALDPNTVRAQICSDPAGCRSGGVGKTTGFVPQGAEYIPIAGRPNPYLANGTFWYSEGNASYHALQLDATRRFSHGLQLRANYSWSKNMDMQSGVTASLAANEPAIALNAYDLMRDRGPAALDTTHQASVSGAYELPFGSGKPWMSGAVGVLGKLASGWQVNWIVTVLSGFPITPQVGSNQSGDGNANNPDRPSVSPAFTGPIILGTPNRWFNPNAYTLPMVGTYGNLGRGTIRGPGLRGLDLSLFKSTRLTEKIRLEFRSEFFNTLNHANFGFPNPTVFSSGAINPSAGIISNTATSSRQIQFGLKLIF